MLARTPSGLRALLALLALLLVLPAAPSPAWAADRPSARALRKAKRKFSRAEVQYRVGNFTQALALYKEALRLARRPSIVFNIAQCYRFLEQPKRAIFFYELYLSEWKRTHRHDPPPNLEEVHAHLDKLRQQAARPRKGALRLEGVPPGATVLIDGMIVGKGPLRAELKLEPGERELRVEARGYLPAVRTVAIEAGETATETIRLVAARRQRSTAWLVTGISGAALAVGAEVTALVFTKETNEEITGSDGFKRYRNLAIASHIAAGTLAVVSGVGFYLWYRSGKPHAKLRDTAAVPALGIVPLAGGALISGRGRF